MKIKKLEYIFSVSSKPGSKTISWGTKHQNTSSLPTPSHVSLLVNNWLILESTLTSGVRIIPLEAWKKSGNTIIYSVKCIKKREWEDLIKSVFKLYGRKYDYLGILYFSYRIILQKFLNIPLPTKNKLESPNKYFCVELIEQVTKEDYEMTSPVQLMLSLAKNLEYNKK